MIKQINFGLIVFTLRFLVIDTKSWENTKYEILSTTWVDSNERVSIKDMDDMPNLYDDFENYLKAILPAIANDAEPMQNPPHDYSFRSAAEKAAAMFDDSEQSYSPSRKTVNVPAPVKPTYNPYRVRSHNETWKGDTTLISLAF